mmetsp:Transcript_16062/g.21643  ORF Transcript_16062/g.21643 Transcript_16062/m.21643 type:complete len:184 (+) Transcript_16062:522-1073(+)
MEVATPSMETCIMEILANHKPTLTKTVETIITMTNLAYSKQVTPITMHMDAVLAINRILVNITPTIVTQVNKGVATIAMLTAETQQQHSKAATITTAATLTMRQLLRKTPVATMEEGLTMKVIVGTNTTTTTTVVMLMAVMLMATQKDQTCGNMTGIHSNRGALLAQETIMFHNPALCSNLGG